MRSLRCGSIARKNPQLQTQPSRESFEDTDSKEILSSENKKTKKTDFKCSAMIT